MTLKVKTKGKLTGTARVGKTLKVKAPKFDRTGVKISFRWSAGGKTIKRRTKSSLKLTKAQKGKKVSVTLTATKAGYKTLQGDLRADREGQEGRQALISDPGGTTAAPTSVDCAWSISGWPQRQQ